MAKESLDKLNEVYKDILGTEISGPDVPKEQDSQEDESTRGKGDGAYRQEDYDGDDEEEATDPREEKEKESETEEDAEETEGTEDFEPIPERLVQAGRRASLDDCTIIDLAEHKPMVLEKLADLQEQFAASSGRQKAETAKKDSEPSAEEKRKKTLDKLDINLDFLETDDTQIGVLTKIRDTVNTLVDRVTQMDQTLEEQKEGLGHIRNREIDEAVKGIDRFFDEKAKDFPILGSSKKLSDKEAEARIFAHRIAVGAQKTMPGLSDSDALQIGIDALKGRLTEAETRAGIVRDLDKNKKRFTMRSRGRRKTSPEGQMPEPERQKKAVSVIQEILNSSDY